MAEMDARTRLLTAHVLHSKLTALEPPSTVTKPLRLWLSQMEAELRGETLPRIHADEVAVADVAKVELINVRGPKQ